MWTAPVSQGEFAASDRIACVHMSGPSMRSHMNADQDGFRDPGSHHRRDLTSAIGTFGLSRVPDRSITPSADHFASSCDGPSELRAVYRGFKKTFMFMPLHQEARQLWENRPRPTP